jgi:hypothetical protein
MIVSFVAIATAGYRRLGRVDEYTRPRGNFLGTMIPYAGPTITLPLTFALTHILIGEVLPLGIANLGITGHLLAVHAAVHLPVVAAPADVKHPKAGTATLLAERLHFGTRDVEKLAPRCKRDEPVCRSGAVLHACVEQRLRGANTRGLTFLP